MDGLFLLSQRDIFHKDRWFAICTRQSRQINHGQTLHSRHPEPAIASNGYVGRPNTALVRVQTVGAADREVIKRSPTVLRRWADAGDRQPKNAISTAEPQVTVLIIREAHHIQIG